VLADPAYVVRSLGTALVNNVFPLGVVLALIWAIVYQVAKNLAEKLTTTAGNLQNTWYQRVKKVDVLRQNFLETTAEISPMGTGLRPMEAVRRVQKIPGLRLRGVHCHVGSQLLDTEAHEGAVDAIVGLMKETALSDEQNLFTDRILKSADKLKNIIDHLKSSLNIAHVRVIGDMDQVCERIAILPGAYSGQRQVSFAEKEKPDVLIVGEVQEWETAEYIRDARLLGSKISLIILGHSVSEEPGMKWLVEWLQPKVPEIKITHVASEDPFTWV